MAKKKQSSGSDSMREKAAAMRAAQEKADRRTRNIIVGVVSVLILAIIAAIIFVIVNRDDSSVDAVPAEFKNGQGIVFNSDGVSAQNISTEHELNFYFDYTCPACVVTDMQIGADLFAGAQAGEYQLVLHPVLTSAGAYNTAATAGLLEVAAYAPQQAAELHQAMIGFAYEAMSSQDTAVLQDLTQSEVAVAEIAAELGINQEVIDRFDSSAAYGYLQASSARWGESEAVGRERLASPEFVYRGHQLDISGEGPALYESLLNAMSQVGL